MITGVSGLQAFKCYIAVKSHFNSKNYNLFKKGIRIRGTKLQLDERYDCKFFYALAEKYYEGDLIVYYMANMMQGNNHPSTMTYCCYADHKAQMKNLCYNFEQDLKKMQGLGHGIKALFGTKSDALPIVLQLLNGGHIALNTVCAINRITSGGIIEKFDKEITDTFLYPKIRLKIVKYQDFMRANFPKLQQILSKYLDK